MPKYIKKEGTGKNAKYTYTVSEKKSAPLDMSWKEKLKDRHKGAVIENSKGEQHTITHYQFGIGYVTSGNLRLGNNTKYKVVKLGKSAYNKEWKKTLKDKHVGAVVENKKGDRFKITEFKDGKYRAVAAFGSPAGNFFLDPKKDYKVIYTGHSPEDIAERKKIAYLIGGSIENQWPHITIELERFRRHDHGGGPDGDDWLDSSEIEKDFDEGAHRYSNRLHKVNNTLKNNGYKPNADFDLGEKGHFTIEVPKLEKLEKSMNYVIDDLAKGGIGSGRRRGAKVKGSDPRDKYKETNSKEEELKQRVKKERDKMRKQGYLKFKGLQNLADIVKGDDEYEMTDQVGQTENGRQIYGNFNNDQHESYTDQDHADAATEHMSMVAAHMANSSDDDPKHSAMAKYHFKQAALHRQSSQDDDVEKGGQGSGRKKIHELTPEEKKKFDGHYSRVSLHHKTKKFMLDGIQFNKPQDLRRHLIDKVTKSEISKGGQGSGRKKITFDGDHKKAAKAHKDAYWDAHMRAAQKPSTMDEEYKVAAHHMKQHEYHADMARKSLQELADLVKSKYTRREGSKGAYKYYYGNTASSHSPKDLSLAKKHGFSMTDKGTLSNSKGVEISFNKESGKYKSVFDYSSHQSNVAFNAGAGSEPVVSEHGSLKEALSEWKPKYKLKESGLDKLKNRVSGAFGPRGSLSTLAYGKSLQDLADLVKGGGHKYIKKIGTGKNAKYTYSEGKGRKQGKKEEEHGEREGHYEYWVWNRNFRKMSKIFDKLKLDYEEIGSEDRQTCYRLSGSEKNLKKFVDKDDHELIEYDTEKSSLQDLADLVKGGGEGSRGGTVTGHYANGKPIYDNHELHEHHAVLEKHGFKKKSRNDSEYVKEHDYEESNRTGFGKREVKGKPKTHIFSSGDTHSVHTKYPGSSGSHRKQFGNFDEALEHANEHIKTSNTNNRHPSKLEDHQIEKQINTHIKKNQAGHSSESDNERTTNLIAERQRRLKGGKREKSLQDLADLVKGDVLEGGKADKKKPSDFPAEAVKEGTKVEMKEHTKNKKVAQEIAMDHLTEGDEYYDELEEMEEDMKEDKKEDKREKSLQDLADLVKGGEGSRGGKVIGRTRSGKAIYDKHGHRLHKDFSPNDHLDAYHIHEKNHNAEGDKHFKSTGLSERGFEDTGGGFFSHKDNGLSLHSNKETGKVSVYDARADEDIGEHANLEDAMKDKRLARKTKKSMESIMKMPDNLIKSEGKEDGEIAKALVEGVSIKREYGNTAAGMLDDQIQKGFISDDVKKCGDMIEAKMKKKGKPDETKKSLNAALNFIIKGEDPETAEHEEEETDEVEMAEKRAKAKSEDVTQKADLVKGRGKDLKPRKKKGTLEIKSDPDSKDVRQVHFNNKQIARMHKDSPPFKELNSPEVGSKTEGHLEIKQSDKHEDVRDLHFNGQKIHDMHKDSTLAKQLMQKSDCGCSEYLKNTHGEQFHSDADKQVIDYLTSVEKVNPYDESHNQLQHIDPDKPQHVQDRSMLVITR